MAGKEDVVRFLIDRGFDKEVRDNHYMRPLGLAARYGHEAVAQLLVSRGADYTWKNGSSQNLLHMAAEGPNNEALIKFFLNKGFGINSTTSRGQSALIYAVVEGRKSNVEFLLENGANTEQTNWNGETALWNAAFYNRLYLVQLLLDNGALTKGASNNRRTKVFWSIVKKQGNKKIIDLLRGHL
jgi:ankyrin repeat protein